METQLESAKVAPTVKVASIVKEKNRNLKTNSKKVEEEEIESQRLSETPLKVDKSSQRGRRRKCEAEFGKTDDVSDAALRVSNERVSVANDNVSDSVFNEEEVGDVKPQTKVKKVKRIIRMGRGPTKAKKRKEEKADPILKESSKVSES